MTKQSDYRSVRGRLVAREKQCRRKIKQVLRRNPGFKSWRPDDEDVNYWVARILAATGLAQDRSKQRGFDGYKYAVLTTQLKYSKGFSSKGKKYAARIYLVTALELFLYACKDFGEGGALQAVEYAAQGNIVAAPVYADSLARAWKWDRDFDSTYAVWAALQLDGLSGASLHSAYPWEDFDPRSEYTWGREHAGREREYNWDDYWRRGGEEPPPPPPPPTRRRPDEWAYHGEPALRDGRTWDEILFGSRVQYATYTDTKRRYRAKMVEHHPDRGGDHDEAAAVVAAWRVAKKIHQYRWEEV
jgi:hypothetical protein